MRLATFHYNYFVFILFTQWFLRRQLDISYQIVVHRFMHPAVKLRFTGTLFVLQAMHSRLHCTGHLVLIVDEVSCVCLYCCIVISFFYGVLILTLILRDYWAILWVDECLGEHVLACSCTLWHVALHFFKRRWGSTFLAMTLWRSIINRRLDRLRRIDLLRRWRSAVRWSLLTDLLSKGRYVSFSSLLIWLSLFNNLILKVLPMDQVTGGDRFKGGLEVFLLARIAIWCNMMNRCRRFLDILQICEAILEITLLQSERRVIVKAWLAAVHALSWDWLRRQAWVSFCEDAWQLFRNHWAPIACHRDHIPHGLVCCLQVFHRRI